MTGDCRQRRSAMVIVLLLLAAGCNGEATEQAGPPRRRPPPIVAGRDATETPRFTTPPAPTRTPGRAIPTSRASWADGLPALIVSNGSDVNHYRRGDPTLAARVDGTARIAYASGAATVIVERDFDNGKRSELVSVRRGRDVETIFGGRAFATLMDVADVDGVRSALFTTYYAPEGGEPSGYLYIHDLRENRRRRVTESGGVVYLMTRASYGGGVIATSSSADLTEVFQFLRPDGTEIEDPPSPTDKLPYSQPPYMTDAVLSDDGSVLAYLEGPDWDHEAEDVVGDWVLVVQDRANGRETHRVKVAEGDVCITWLDFDGRWAVMSRETRGRDENGYDYCGAPGSKARSVAVLDTRADELELVELTDVVGVATIDN